MQPRTATAARGWDGAALPPAADTNPPLGTFIRGLPVLPAPDVVVLRAQRRVVQCTQPLHAGCAAHRRAPRAHGRRTCTGTAHGRAPHRRASCTQVRITLTHRTRQGMASCAQARAPHIHLLAAHAREHRAMHPRALRTHPRHTDVHHAHAHTRTHASPGPARRTPPHAHTDTRAWCRALPGTDPRTDGGAPPRSPPPPAARRGAAVEQSGAEVRTGGGHHPAPAPTRAPHSRLGSGSSAGCGRRTARWRTATARPPGNCRRARGRGRWRRRRRAAAARAAGRAAGPAAGRGARRSPASCRSAGGGRAEPSAPHRTAPHRGEAPAASAAGGRGRGLSIGGGASLPPQPLPYRSPAAPRAGPSSAPGGPAVPRTARRLCGKGTLSFAVAIRMRAGSL